GARLHLQGDAHALFFVRFVGQAEELRQLPRADDLANRLFELALVDAIRNRRDDNLLLLGVLLYFPLGPHFDASASLFLDLAERGSVRDDLAAKREVWALDLVHELGGRGIGIVDQVDAGPADLAQVVRRDVRGHTDRDAARAVDEQVRELGWQDDRLLA